MSRSAWSGRSMSPSACRGSRRLRPRLEGYLASIAGYRKNRHDELARAATPSHRPRVGPELRRVGVWALTRPTVVPKAQPR